jgi:carbon monoxide dehydrogenase subunit G
MNVHGTFHFGVPRERVFAAIRDQRVLLAVIPGCEAVEQTGPDEYEGRMTLRLPGAAGSFRTHVALVDIDEPSHAGLRGRVEGTLGSIEGDASFDLADEAKQTSLEYSGTAQLQGPLARLDSRLVERLAETLIAQGLKSLEARLVTEDAA